MRADTYSLIHLPDLQFAQWCFREFGINRGIYNTIDSWFYQNGIKEITERRIYSLNFFLSLNQPNHITKIKFGPGGLVATLNQFWEESIKTNEKYKIERAI